MDTVGHAYTSTAQEAETQELSQFKARQGYRVNSAPA